jgi:hypothetical protein
MKDLVILVADKNMEFSIKGILSRPQALSIRQINFDIFVHPHHDPGCLNEGHHFLQSFLAQSRHALILFDREGCGRENLTRQQLEQIVENNLFHTGWQQAAAVVLDPELEIWVWNDSSHVAEILGWKNKQPDLNNWLIKKGFLQEGEIKPLKPKESMEVALKQVRKPRSSILYRQLAEKVSFRRCTDDAFYKFKTTLQNWFSI